MKKREWAKAKVRVIGERERESILYHLIDTSSNNKQSLSKDFGTSMDLLTTSYGPNYTPFTHY